MHFPDAPTSGNLDSIVAYVDTWRNSMSSFVSPAVAGSGHTVKIYDVGALPDAPPLRTGFFDLSHSFTTTPMPNEVACCLSYHAEPQPGVNRQSWRGRMYLGPFCTTAIEAVAANARPGATFKAQILNTGAIFFANLLDLSGSGSKAVILSKKTGFAYPIDNVSVDDEWDTQRSRGLRATTVSTTDVEGGGGAPIAV